MSIQTSMDSLKRVALKQVIENLGDNIKSIHIYDKLVEYIRYGSNGIFALTSLYSPNTKIAFESDFNAKLTLAYLELFTQYIINSSNSETINKLSSISYSKYLYVIFRHKEMYATFNEKSKLKEYKYVRHVDFSAPKNIFWSKSLSNLFGLSGTLQLSYNNTLSLPILSSKKIYPNDIISYINDHTVALFEHDSDNKNIFSTIYRKYGNFIGSLKSAEYVLDTNIENKDAIKFSGLTNGYLADSIYFRIDTSSYDGVINNIVYSTSIDGYTWEYQSSTLTIDPNVEYSIYILNNLDTKLKFRLDAVDVSQITDGMTWLIHLRYTKLPSPTCSIKLIFNMLIPISYVIFNDISEYPLDIGDNIVYKLDETSESNIIDSIFDGFITNIIPINSRSYSIDIPFIQNRYKVSSVEDYTALKYNYDLADITGISNVYYPIGSIMFDPLDVENISTIELDTFSTHVSNITSESISRLSNIFSIITETKHGISEIPIIDKSTLKITGQWQTGKQYYFGDIVIYEDIQYQCVSDHISTGVTINTDKFKPGYYMLEPIVIDNRTLLPDTTYIDYKTKFKFLKNNTPTLYKFNPYIEYIGENSNPYTYTRDTNTLSINIGDNVGAKYIFMSDIYIGTMADLNSDTIDENSKWNITSNNTVYMFYFDYDNNVKLAIKTKSISGDNALSPFTGKIYGKVTMFSAAESYISQYISHYTLSCI